MAFGEVLFDEHLVNPKQPYLFNGKELDMETGLYYYGARYYDPRTSIFLSVDPLVEKTGTPYAYTYNNPINLIDPTGMESDGWIEQISGGKKSYTYDASVNSIEDAQKAGYKNVSNVYSSATISRESTLGFGGYSYRLNENGSVTDKNSGDPIYNTFTTGAGSTINALQGTFISEAKMDFIDQWSTSDNKIAAFSYSFLNDIYVTAQVFDFGLMERPEWDNPYIGGNFGNLDGTPNYHQASSLVNTVSNIVTVARGTQGAKSIMPQGLTIANKLNAAQFSKAFKSRKRNASKNSSSRYWKICTITRKKELEWKHYLSYL